MNTDFALTIACERRDSSRAMRLLDRAHDQLAGFEREWSEFLPESPVARFNAEPVGTSIHISSELDQLLSLCCEIEEQTRGYFSCGIKGLIKQGASAPMQEWIAWNRDKMTKLKPWAHLGFGAVGKGFALDLIRVFLEREGFENYLLSGGGSSLVVSGESKPGVSWKIAWELAADQHIALPHWTNQAWAIGVSSEQVQKGHILSAQGHAKKYRSVWIGDRSAARADAWSTAVYAAGEQANFQNHEAACATIDQSGVPQWNSKFQNLWGPIRSLAVSALLLLSVSAFSQESEEVDLSRSDSPAASQLVAPDQEVHREPLWILLPAISLGAVLLHSVRKKKRGRL